MPIYIIYTYIHIYCVYSVRLLSDADGTHTLESPLVRLRDYSPSRVAVVVWGVVNQSNKVPNNIYRLGASSCRRRIKHDRIIRTVLFFSPFSFWFIDTLFSPLLYTIIVYMQGRVLYYNVCIYTHYDDDDLSSLRVRFF